MDEMQYQKLLADSKAYLNTKYDLLRLSLVEKLGKVLGMILFVLVALVLLVALLAFVAVALAFVLAQWLPLWAAFLILGCVFLLQLVLVIVFRKQMFVNPLIGALSNILFSDERLDEDPASEETEAERKEVPHV